MSYSEFIACLFRNRDSKRSVLKAGDDDNRESNDLFWWFGGEYSAFRRNAKYVSHLEQQSEVNLLNIKWGLY